ncbi:hypothetical protein [Polaromonas sp.]|uniref:hypothetical protein n=1 Tax=Polaromonas sp. TaxID=1869339 RepID=UPI00352AF197
MNKPVFITFTGADRYTDIMGMLELSDQYSIEWGLLFSPDRQGKADQNRYPPLSFLREVTAIDMSFAAHLCGGDAQTVLQGGASNHDEFLSVAFERAQINTSKPVDLDRIAVWGGNIDISVIVQSRDLNAFPSAAQVQWLFDASGGRGLSPTSWPLPTPGRLNGYAGGLNPLNVGASVEQIGSFIPGASIGTSYWIDMESGVRDERDRFCLKRCRAVCEAVFGDPGVPRDEQAMSAN